MATTQVTFTELMEVKAAGNVSTRYLFMDGFRDGVHVAKIFKYKRAGEVHPWRVSGESQTFQTLEGAKDWVVKAWAQ